MLFIYILISVLIPPYDFRVMGLKISVYIYISVHLHLYYNYNFL